MLTEDRLDDQIKKNEELNTLNKEYKEIIDKNHVFIQVITPHSSLLSLSLSLSFLYFLIIEIEIGI